MGTPGTARALECYGCCGTAEGPRVAVLSCAGTCVSGDLGSNECPAGSARIETVAACRTAVVAAGKTECPIFIHNSAASPRGCWYITDSNYASANNVAKFNTHAVGSGGDSRFRLLCAATGAPLHAPTRRRACAARCSRAVGLIIQTAQM